MSEEDPGTFLLAVGWPSVSQPGAEPRQTQLLWGGSPDPQLRGVWVTGQTRLTSPTLLPQNSGLLCHALAASRLVSAATAQQKGRLSCACGNCRERPPRPHPGGLQLRKKGIDSHQIFMQLENDGSTIHAAEG